MRLSVIIPALNEEEQIEAVVQQARQPGVGGVIVVDGGSSDATVELASAVADRCLSAARGRARQMNAGAATANGDILVFVHADTLVPAGFARAIAGALDDAAVVGGRFDVALMPSTPLLRLVATLMNLRSRLSGIATGDQAIFVRREVFARLGGFSDLPLMEDIDFSRRLKRAGGIACLRERVTTSSRRWRADGAVRTILRMWTLRLLYSLGVSPARLRRAYADRR